MLQTFDEVEVARREYFATISAVEHLQMGLDSRVKGGDQPGSRGQMPADPSLVSYAWLEGDREAERDKNEQGVLPLDKWLLDAVSSRMIRAQSLLTFFRSRIACEWLANG